MAKPTNPNTPAKFGAGGIGNEMACLDDMDDFVAMTGGSLAQRRIQRDYSKAAHAEYKEAMDADDSDDMSANISTPRRVF